MDRNPPEICKNCEHREQIKSMNHKAGRYKALYEKKQWTHQKLRMDMRLQKNHLKKMKKKINWLLKQIEIGLKR